MNTIAAFLLCLSQEEEAFMILCYLMDFILPDHFYASSERGLALFGLKMEIFIILQYVKDFFQFSQPAEEFTDQFLHHIGVSLLVPLLVNGLDSRGMVLMWEQIIKCNSVHFCLRVIKNERWK